MVRAAGSRAIVEIAHTDLSAARTAWNGPLSEPGGRSPLAVRTYRTWGTLRDAKVWLASQGPA